MPTSNSSKHVKDRASTTVSLHPDAHVAGADVSDVHVAGADAHGVNVLTSDVLNPDPSGSNAAGQEKNSLLQVHFNRAPVVGQRPRSGLSADQLTLGSLDSELDGYIERFEQAIADDPASEVQTFFPASDHPRFREIICELLRVDMELQATAGRQVSALAYRRRFPNVLDQDSIFRPLLDEEKRLRLSGQLSTSDPAGTVNPETPLGQMPCVGRSACGFDLIAELGQGAFSRVFLALEQRLARRRVVLKVSSELPGEAEVLSRLQHKNIVPVYSLHAHGEYHLICMPFLGTLTLAHLLLSDTPSVPGALDGKALVSTLAAKGSRTWKNRPESTSQVNDSASLHNASPSSRNTTPLPEAWPRSTTFNPHNNVHNDSQKESQNDTQKTPQPSSQPSSDQRGGIAPTDGIEASPGLSTQLVQELANMSSPELALWMVAQLAEGLSHAHERGILHRDIKPANILLSDDGLPMLLDFNLSVNQAQPSSDNLLGGTLRYMAPEQLAQLRLDRSAASHEAQSSNASFASEKAVGAPADIFSLGVVLYELLYRRPAFADRTGSWRTVIEQLHHERATLPKMPMDWKLGITPAVVQILSRSLAFRPRDRYQSAAELRDDLRAHLANQPLLHAVDRSPRERLRKWNARHPRLSAISLATSIAVILLCSTISWFAWRQSHINRLSATNWLHDVGQTQAMARQLLGGDQVPVKTLQEVLERTEPAVDDALARHHMAHLNAQGASEAKLLLSRLHFYRARGAWAMLCRLPKEQQPWLRTTLVELRASDRWHASPLTTLWLDTLEPLSRDNTSIDGPLTAQQTAAIVKLRDSAETLQRELAAAQQAIATEASNPWHWISIGQLQMAQRQVPEAQASFLVSRQLAPDDALPAFMLGITEMQSKRFAQAKRWFSIALDHDANFTEALFNRAAAQVELGQLAEALADIERLQLDIDQIPRAWFIREIAARRLGQEARAVEYRKTGLAIEPRDALGWNARGEAWLRHSPVDAQAALHDFEQAIAVDPQFRKAYENAAHVLSERLNRAEDAVGQLDAVLSIDPTYALAWSSRSVLHARAGRNEAARRDLEQALKLDRAPIICYQAASALSLLTKPSASPSQDPERIIDLLKETLRKDPSLAKFMRRDSDLGELIHDKSFQEILIAANRLQ